MTDVLQHEIDRVGKPRGLWPQFVYYADKILPTRIGLFIPISVRKPGDWSMRCVVWRAVAKLTLRRNLSTGSSVWMTPMGRSEPVTPASLYTHLHRGKGELGLIKRSRLMPFRASTRCTIAAESSQSSTSYSCVHRRQSSTGVSLAVRMILIGQPAQRPAGLDKHIHREVHCPPVL